MSGKHEDELSDLTYPTQAGDHMLVGRGGVVYRADRPRVVTVAPRVGVIRPQASDFGTWVNQGSATIRDRADGCVIEAPTQSSDSLNCRVRTLSGGTFAFDVQLCCVRGWPFKTNLVGGLLLRESSTSKIESLNFGHPSSSDIATDKWTNSTTFSAQRRAYGSIGPLAFFRITMTGGNLRWWVSHDGVTWAILDDPIAINNFFTTAPDQWGFFVNSNNSGTPNVDVRMDVLHWEEHVGEINIMETASYLNANGTGNRLSQITVTTTATIQQPSSPSGMQGLVDGTGNNGNSPFFNPAGQSGVSVTFQFTGGAKIVTEAKWYQNVSASHGTWKWQGSNDGSTFTDISSTFTLDGTSTGTVIGDLSANTTAYSYYRMLQTSGTVTDTPFLREIEFKIKN